MGSTGGEINSVNSGRVRIDNDKNRLIVNNGSTDILLAGEDNSGNIVFKVAQSGYDVKTATNQQLSFSSAFNSFKIVQSGTTSISKSANNSGLSVTVNHNLGYTPAVLAYANYAGGLFPGTSTSGYCNPLPCLHQYQIVTAPAYGSYTASIVDAVLSAYADTTLVRFTISTPSDTNGSTAAYNSAYTIGIKYYILAETAS